MGKLEKAILTLNTQASADTSLQKIDSRALLMVTLLYIVAVLSLPLTAIASLIWFAAYPIIISAWLGVRFRSIFLKSLIILPLIVFIGAFNPYFDRVPYLRIGSVSISRGWITFLAITLRGLYAFQAVLILVASTGFTGLCNGLRRIGLPRFLSTQLLMVYRYLTVMLQEALQMRRARESRGYGKKSMSLKMWGTYIGQLFIRTVERSERINNAMLARGFNGSIPIYNEIGRKWATRDTVFVAVCAAAFALLRFIPPEMIFHLNKIL